MKLKLNQTAGFTLVEILMVIAIMAVISFFAALNTMNSAAGYQLQTTADNLVQSLREARTEAVARNTTVDILLNSNGQDCLLRRLNPTTNVVVETLTLKPIDLVDHAAGINLTFTSGFSAGVDRVIFNNRGRITNLAAGATSATITVTCPRLAEQGVITLTLWPQTGYITRN